MGKIIYNVGTRIGNLTLIKRKRIKKHTWYVCRCDCGNIIETRLEHLLKKKDKTCGCFYKTKKRIRRIWYGMLARTMNPKVKCYKNYGGRGISVCKEWINDFVSFYKWSLENGYKDYLTIDRINNNGNYTPENCRWSTHKEQQRCKRNNIISSFNGKDGCIAELAEFAGIRSNLVYSRLRRGYSVEQALTVPVGVRRK